MHEVPPDRLRPRVARVLSFVVHSARAEPQPADDPFVKKPAEAKAASEAGVASWTQPVSILEVYALDLADAHGVLEAERGNAARYLRVLELHKNGKARLETLTAMSAKSGQRARSESVDEVRYPKEFTAYAGAATAWEVRSAGDTLEVEFVVAADRRVIDINLVPQRTGLVEFCDHKGMAGDFAVSQPVFRAQKLTSSTTLIAAAPQLLGTFSFAHDRTPPPAAGGREVSLAFLRVNATSPAASSLRPEAKPLDGAVLRFHYTLLSLERAAAREVVVAQPALDDAWKRMQALLSEKKARVEGIVSLTTKSGQRAVVEDGQEMRIVSDYQTPDRAKTGEETPGHARTFETRATGITVELEPVLSPDGVALDLNHAVTMTTHLGALQTTGVAKRYPAQPLFESRSVTTSQTLLIGTQHLVGTFNPPGADGVNGRTDDGRTWLLFVRATSDEP